MSNKTELLKQFHEARREVQYNTTIINKNKENMKIVFKARREITKNTKIMNRIMKELDL